MTQSARHNVALWFALAIAGFIFHSAGFAAKVPPPPIEAAFDAKNLVGEYKVLRFTDDTHIEVKLHKAIWGEADNELVLGLPADHVPKIETGDRYIITYSHLARHPLYRDNWIKNPDGPTVVRLPFAGTAVFESSKNTRYLFKTLQKSVADNQRKARKVITDLLDEIESDRPNSRHLSVIELAQQQPLYPHMNDRQANRIRKVIEGRGLADDEQEYLLSASAGLQEKYQGQWIADVCRQTIDDAGVEYELTSGKPLLVRTCVGLLAVHGNNSDIVVASELLFSNAPGVAKAAFSTLLKLDKPKAEQIVQQALRGERALHNETRRVLTAYLK